MRARNAALSGVPATGASWIMIGNLIASRDAGEESWIGLAHADRRAVVRRHHHDHGRAEVLSPAAALSAQPATEVSGGNDDRYTARDMGADGLGQQLALGIGEHELFGKIGQYAQAVGAGVDHEIDAPLLAREVELTGLSERRRHNGEDTLIACCEPGGGSV